MSSKKYIRIYANGQKVRCTGGSKWWWESIIRNLTYTDKDVKEKPILIHQIMSEYLANSSYLLYDKSGVAISLHCEIIKKNSSGKHIQKTIDCPWFLKNDSFNLWYLIWSEDPTIRYIIPTRLLPSSLRTPNIQ